MALHERHVLRDAREVAHQAGRVLEEAREVGGDVRPGRRPRAGAVPFGFRGRADDEHQAAGQQCSHDVGVVIRLDRRARLGAEPGLLAQDRPVQLLERRARVDAELLVQRATRVVEDLERVALAAGSVEREHQVPAQPLP